jgi:hypothetical protein
MARESRIPWLDGIAYQDLVIVLLEALDRGGEHSDCFKNAITGEHP